MMENLESPGCACPKTELGNSCWNTFSNCFADLDWSDLDLIGLDVFVALHLSETHVRDIYCIFNWILIRAVDK